MSKEIVEVTANDICAAINDCISERDTYRQLCEELLKTLHDAQNTLAHCKAGTGYHRRQTDTAININVAIEKAEQQLNGEKK